MFCRLVPGIGRRGGARHVPLHQCLELPGPAQAVLVATALEDRYHGVDGPCRFLRAAVRDAQELQELLLDHCMRVGTIVLGRSGELSRLLEDGLCIVQSARLDQRSPQLREKRCTSRCVEREQIRRSLEETDRSRKVTPRQRPSTCRLEPLC